MATKPHFNPQYFFWKELMRKKKYWKIIGKKFAGSFFLLLVLVLFTNYLSFLLRFNFQANLTASTKGKFYRPFLRQLSLPNLPNNKDADWTKLLSTFLFGYFLVNLPAQLALDCGQKYYERLLTVYLTKYLLNWVEENKKLMEPKQKKKLIILPNLVADFSHQLLALLINFFSLTSNIVLSIYSLYFFRFRASPQKLEHSPAFVLGFNFVILVSFVSFFFFLHSDMERSKQQSQACQQVEKIQVQTWLENLNFDPSRNQLKEIFASLDHNSSSMFSALFASAIFRLPKLIIPGTSILFCFLYRNYCRPDLKMNWNIYLIALNCQNLFWKISQMLDLWPAWKSFRHNYSQLTSFFSLLK